MDTQRFARSEESKVWLSKFILSVRKKYKSETKLKNEQNQKYEKWKRKINNGYLDTKVCDKWRK